MNEITLCSIWSPLCQCGRCAITFWFLTGLAQANPALREVTSTKQTDHAAPCKPAAFKEDALVRAGSLQNLGDPDKADLQLQEVLRRGSTNDAARRGMEQGEQIRSQYHDAAKDHRRARDISGNAAMWEDPLPAVDLSHLFGSAGVESRMTGSDKQSVLQKLRTLIVPLVDFESVSLSEVVDFLRVRSRDLDPAKRGIGFVFHASPEIQAKRLTLQMSSVPLEEVLRQAARLVGADYRVEEHAVVISSLENKQEALVSRQYRVPPNFLQTMPVAAPGGGLQSGRLGAKELLQQRGVPFPPGATASFTPATNVLFVRNTVPNLMLVDSLVDQAVNVTAKQVEIQIRMVEVSDARVKELGFDWLLSEFNLPGSDKIFAGGGGQVAPGTVLPLPGRTVTGGLRGVREILGLRSSGTKIGRAMLPGADPKSPGMFAVSGVLTDPQFQGVLRGLNQSEGVNVLASPTLFAKSGERASLKMVQEFRYPKEYDSPETPISSSGGGPGKPSSPRSYETKDVGIYFEVEPIVGQNQVIELSLSPHFVEFEGFINYGQSFQQPAANDPTGQPTYITVQNQILQPIFRVNRISTAVSIWDGCTVVLGGAANEKRFRGDDKVPALGDLPLVGRAFQSKVTQRECTNVLFFVTARIVDPGGNEITTKTASQDPR